MKPQSCRPLLVILALCTFLVQGVASVHAISHTPGPRQKNDQVTADNHRNGDCELCLAFATVGASAPSAPLLLPGAAASGSGNALCPCPAPTAPLRHYRARAPPALSSAPA